MGRQRGQGRACEDQQVPYVVVVAVVVPVVIVVVVVVVDDDNKSAAAAIYAHICNHHHFARWPQAEEIESYCLGHMEYTNPQPLFYN